MIMQAFTAFSLFLVSIVIITACNNPNSDLENNRLDLNYLRFGVEGSTVFTENGNILLEEDGNVQ